MNTDFVPFSSGLYSYCTSVLYHFKIDITVVIMSLTSRNCSKKEMSSPNVHDVSLAKNKIILMSHLQPKTLHQHVGYYNMHFQWKPNEFNKQHRMPVLTQLVGYF